LGQPHRLTPEHPLFEVPADRIIVSPHAIKAACNRCGFWVSTANEESLPTSLIQGRLTAYLNGHSRLVHP
jgi:hypothetical protein